MYAKTRAAGFGAEAKRRIMLGTYALRSGYYDAYYLRAQKVRTLIKRDFARAFEQCQVIATPTAPNVAFPSARKSRTRCRCISATSSPCPCNLAGLPGVSLPCGFVEGLPVGLAIVGAAAGRGDAVCRRCRLSARQRLAHAPPAGAGLSMELEAVIGLECHVQLQTVTKAFTSALGGVRRRAQHAHRSLYAGAAGHAAGAVARRRRARDQARAGHALHASASAAALPVNTIFIPICQRVFRSRNMDEPLCENGRVAVRRSTVKCDEVRLTRIHMEEDAGKNMHVAGAPLFARRLQPRRRAARRDRVRARPALGGGGGGVSARHSPARALSRHLRRQHGRGLACAATPTSRASRRRHASSARKPS